MSRQNDIVLARMVNMMTKLDNFSTAQLKLLEKFYRQAAAQLLKDVKAARGKSARLWTNTRLIALLEEAQLQHAAIIAQMTQQTARAVVEAGQYAYDQTNNIVSWDGKVTGFNTVALSATQLSALATDYKLGGKLLNEWIGAALRPDIDTIKAEVAQGYIRGESYAKIVSRLQAALELAPGSDKLRDLESVVKTYIQSITSKANQDVYEANQEVVDQVEWSAILEPGNTKTGRGTCPRCMALDGKRWATADTQGRPDCPLHVRCRCMLYPVTKSWRDLGFDVDEMERSYNQWTVRDAKGNLIDFGTFDGNYAKWWASQPKAFQDNAIGPVRADMIRKGLISFDDIIDHKGNLIPIKNLELVSFISPKAIHRGYGYIDLLSSGKDVGTILSISDDCDE